MEKELKSGKPDLDNNQPISPYRETGIRLYSVHLRCLRDVILLSELCVKSTKY